MKKRRGRILAYGTQMLVELRRSIFPFYRFKGKDIIEDVDFLGTCFFMRFEKWVVMFTARHNLNWDFQPNEKFIVAERIGEDTNHVTVEGAFTKKKSEDISFIIVKPECLQQFKNPIVLLPLWEQKLTLGDDVFSYGYPLTIKRTESHTRVITIYESMLFLKGYIQNIVKREIITESVPNNFEISYCLSFVAPEGLSGAPLLVGRDNQVFVAGIIYGNWPIDYKVRFSEEIKSEAGSQMVIQTTRYEFGLSSTFLPILEARKLLEDFEKRPKSS